MNRTKCWFMSLVVCSKAIDNVCIMSVCVCPDLVKGREHNGVCTVLWEVDMERCGVFRIGVGLDSPYGVQHLFKFI